MKKTMIRLLSLILALSSLLLPSGCARQPGSQPEPSGPSQADEPPVQQPEQQTPDSEQSNPTLGLAYYQNLGLDPYNCVALANRAILPLVYEGLFRVSSSFTAEPVLCSSYTVSSDGLSYTFSLQPNVSFHNGKKLTAADVVYSLTECQSSSYYGNRLYNVASITALSQTQVELVLLNPMDNLPVLLDIPIIPLGAKSSRLPAGTGPYLLPTSTGVLKANPRWWQERAGLTQQEQWQLVNVASSSEIRDQFEYAEVNLVCADPSSDAAATYHSDYELWSCPTTIMQYVGFNLQREPFSNEALRSIITYAVDRSTIVSSLCGGFADAASLPVNPASDYYDAKLAAKYDYSPETFRTQLSSSGPYAMEATFLVCSSSSQRVAAAQQIADAVNSFGFHLTVEALPYEQYKQALLQGDYDLYYGEARLSASFDLTQFFTSDGSMCFGGMADSSVEALCQFALENGGNSYDLYKRILERGLLCPVLFKTYAVYTTRGAFSNLTPAMDHVLWQAPQSQEALIKKD